MKAIDYREVPAKIEHGVEGVTARWPIREEDGAPHFAMRIFDVEPGVKTPHHSHWWEHEIYVMAGKGVVEAGGQRVAVQEGMVVYIPGGEEHHLENAGDDAFRFMCLIPHRWLKGKAEEHYEAKA
jgi:quercetin dioxygenase-like cupin family protein